MNSNTMLQQGHRFIDQVSCGSSVGYKMHLNEWERVRTGVPSYEVVATVRLSDCNRFIEWQFENDGMNKIDAAIETLQEFRKKYYALVRRAERLTAQEEKK